MRSGSQVLAHRMILPEPSPSAGNNSLSTTASTWSVLNTASTMGSQCRARSATDEAGRPPSSASLAVVAGSTSKPTTSKPASSRRCANAWPNRPRPIRPIGLRSGMSLIHHRRPQIGATFRMLELRTSSSARAGGDIERSLPSHQPSGAMPRLRAAHGADRGIDLALEYRHRRERFDRHRNDGMAGIGGLALLLDEIDDVAPERRL